MERNDFFMNQKLFCETTKEIALFMYNVGITEKPELSFFENDCGIFERFFTAHITEPEILALKTISEDVYLRVLGMHALGAGAYIAAKKLESGQKVSGFTQDEVESFFSEFDVTDAFELALKKLGLSIDSGNKKILDRIILIVMKEAKIIAGEKIMEPQNIKAFMKVLFNAGTSICLLRKR